MPAAIAVAGLALSAYSINQQRQLAKKQANLAIAQSYQESRLYTLDAKKAEVENMANIRSSIRQARAQRALVVNAGANAGVSKSSGVQGGAGSVQSQLRGELSDFYKQRDIQQQMVFIQGGNGGWEAEQARQQKQAEDSARLLAALAAATGQGTTTTPTPAPSNSIWNPTETA